MSVQQIESEEVTMIETSDEALEVAGVGGGYNPTDKQSSCMCLYN